MKIPRIILTALLTLSLPCLYADATSQLPQSMMALQEEAANGNPEAQYELGIFYSTLNDHAQAIHWIQLAADQGFAEAIRNLGECYLKGIGIDRTGKEEECDLKAIELISKAVEKGDPRAHFLLAACYMTGIGKLPPIDDAKIYQLLQFAAEHGIKEAQMALVVINVQRKNAQETLQKAESGDPNTQNELGLYYAIIKEEAKAVKCFQLAADQGHANALSNLAECYLNGFGIDRTGKEKEYDLAAIELLNKAVEKGDPRAHFLLAGCHMEALGNLPRNLTKIYKLMQFAADHHVEEAMTIIKMFNDPNAEGAKAMFKAASESYDEGNRDPELLKYLAGCYNAGDFVPVDTQRALELYTEAAEGGSAAAQYSLGKIYRLGLLKQKVDNNAWIYWMKKSADQGYGPAIAEIQGASKALETSALNGDVLSQFAMGSKYYNSQKDLAYRQQALKWYEMAAEQGYAAAEYQMGIIYYKGELVQKDIKRALDYWRKASHHGDTSAQQKLWNHFHEDQREADAKETEEMKQLRSILKKKGRPVEEAAEREDSFLNDIVMVLCDFLTAVLQKFA